MVELHITVRFPVSQLSSLNPQLNKAALRLTVNPFGSQARHFPYIALTRDTEEDIAAFPAFNHDAQLHCPIEQ